jgi:hypothetical protein
VLERIDTGDRMYTIDKGVRYYGIMKGFQGDNIKIWYDNKGEKSYNKKGKPSNVKKHLVFKEK